MLRMLIIFVLQWIALNVFTQNESYYTNSYLRYDDYVYSENYKSVKLYRTGFQYTIPIIHLNSKETLTISFDDLNAQSQTYNYTYILCDADWKPADLLPMEYMDGMNEGYFSTNTSSFNTTRRYTHYELQFPSNSIRFTRSGNYILKVYPEGEPENPVITRRFYVLENKVEIESEYFMAKAPQYRYTHQEMYIKVSLMNYPMPNVYENFTMRIVQNGRKDNVIVKHQPKMITNDYLYFNFPNDILFEGGNEYRTFDTRSLKTQSARINSIGYTREGYRVTLLNDQSRLGKNYLNYTDLNGDYAVITWDDSQFRNQIESDYTFVDFSFELDSVLSDGGIYLMGELSNWRIDNSSRMEYNSQEKKYTKTLLLKQGYYDYHYLYVPNGKSTGRLMPFEGSFSETDNSYSVFVYYRDQGQLWDRLIGYENVKTK